VALHTDVRNPEEIRAPVDLQPALLEDLGGDAHRRRIDVGRRAHVAHVVDDRLDVPHRQGTSLARVDVGEGAVADAKLVDPQRIDGLQRLLPAVLLHGGGVL